MKRHSIRSILSLVLALLMLLSMTASAFATEGEDNKKAETNSRYAHAKSFSQV